MTVEEYFSTGPAHERPVFDAIAGLLAGVGPVDVEPVSVGILLKREGRTFAELRPMRAWVAVWFSLPRRAAHRTIVRKVLPYGGRYVHVANVAVPGDLDRGLRDLLVEAYETR